MAVYAHHTHTQWRETRPPTRTHTPAHTERGRGRQTDTHTQWRETYRGELSPLLLERRHASGPCGRVRRVLPLHLGRHRRLRGSPRGRHCPDGRAGEARARTSQGNRTGARNLGLLLLLLSGCGPNSSGHPSQCSRGLVGGVGADRSVDARRRGGHVREERRVDLEHQPLQCLCGSKHETGQLGGDTGNREARQYVTVKR